MGIYRVSTDEVLMVMSRLEKTSTVEVIEEVFSFGYDCYAKGKYLDKEQGEYFYVFNDLAFNSTLKREVNKLITKKNIDLKFLLNLIEGAYKHERISIKY